MVMPDGMWNGRLNAMQGSRGQLTHPNPLGTMPAVCLTGSKGQAAASAEDYAVQHTAPDDK